MLAVPQTRSMTNPAVEALGVAVAARVPVLLWGAPGTGKTSAIRAMAEAMGLPCETVIASIREPSDFAGLPIVAGDSVRFAPPMWARRLADPVVAMASGWMRVRQRAKSRGVELPLVISDHADWNELHATLDEVGAPEVWVTHGREEALIHAAAQRGIRGRALRLVGYDEEDEGEAA